MSDQKTKDEIGKLQGEIVKNREKINELRKKASPEKVRNYEFKDPKGNNVKLSEMCSARRMN